MAARFIRGASIRDYDSCACNYVERIGIAAAKVMKFGLLDQPLVSQSARVLQFLMLYHAGLAPLAVLQKSSLPS